MFLAERTRGRWIAAWVTHALTASGAVWGLLALVAATERDWKTTFGWVFVAGAVDSVDGTLARMVGVKRVTPEFDGALLDNTMDYVTYVFVPAFVMHHAGLLPTSISVSVAAVICVASAYQFCQRNAKTSDCFFLGFPSYWNIVAFYLFLGDLDPRVNATLVVVLAVFAFVPLKWVYPSRMTRWRQETLVATGTWAVMCVAMLARFPSPPSWLLVSSLGYVGYYVAVSLYLQTHPET
ncbi:MAG: hypothetical protein VYE68_09235 [Acidobacteriota bacterium]|nr:hypothetical protein [Acidobacteriota bacterium]